MIYRYKVASGVRRWYELIIGDGVYGRKKEVIEGMAGGIYTKKILPRNFDVLVLRRGVVENHRGGWNLKVPPCPVDFGQFLGRESLMMIGLP